MSSLAALVLLGTASLAHALSWPLADSVGATWVSSSPRLSGAYPYYQMLGFYTGNLNLEGSGVDVCINSGKDCGLPAADAFCQYAGFDGAVEDEIKVVDATEPVRAVTGEWCLSPGVYSTAEATSTARLAASTPAPPPGQPSCARIDALVCYRKRSSMAGALASLRARLAAAAPAGAPAAAPLPTPAASEASGSPAAAPTQELPLVAQRLPTAHTVTAAGTATRPAEVGGRKLLLS